MNEQICAATLGWNDQKWEKIGGRTKPKLRQKLRQVPEADPPPATAPEERDAFEREAAWGVGDSKSDGTTSVDDLDLDPAATLAGRLRFVSLSATPTVSNFAFK